MGTQLTTWETPFDVLFKNFFERDTHFNLLVDSKAAHPVDVYETEAGLTFEVACTGLTKSDVDISIENDILRIKYAKQSDTVEQDKKVKYYNKSIARRSFNLGYKIASRFDLQATDAKMENGLLSIFIPSKVDVVKTKSISIQ
jgi:HSP20 family molecular chaperone IbpA